MERKSERFWGVKLFRSNFKVNFKFQCLNKNLLSRLWFFVHMRQFHFDLYCFFNFLDRIFLNIFPNSFVVHSRASFLFEPNFLFSIEDFCSHAALWHFLFKFFDPIFFINGFSIYSSFILLSSFLYSQWKFFELYGRTCPAMVFYIVVAIFVTTTWRHNHDPTHKNDFFTLRLTFIYFNSKR